MGKLLTSNKEDGISVVDEFREEVPPGHVSCGKPIVGVRVVNRLTQPVILPGEPELTSFDEKPEAEECLEEVVGYHYILDVIRRSIFHEFWSSKPYDIVIQCT